MGIEKERVDVKDENVKLKKKVTFDNLIVETIVDEHGGKIPSEESKKIRRKTLVEAESKQDVKEKEIDAGKIHGSKIEEDKIILNTMTISEEKTKTTKQKNKIKHSFEKEIIKNREEDEEEEEEGLKIGT